MEFGAFVNFFGAKDGLVHISQLAANRVQKTSDVVKEGDKVKVKLLGFDDRGKTRLSMKAVDQVTGEDLEAKPEDRSSGARSRRRVSIAAVKDDEGRLFSRPFCLPKRSTMCAYAAAPHAAEMKPKPV